MLREHLESFELILIKLQLMMKEKWFSGATMKHLKVSIPYPSKVKKSLIPSLV